MTKTNENQCTEEHEVSNSSTLSMELLSVFTL